MATTLISHQSEVLGVPVEIPTARVGAEAALLESHDIYAQSSGATASTTLRSARALHALYTKMGKDDEAAAWQAKLDAAKGK